MKHVALVSQHKTSPAMADDSLLVKQQEVALANSIIDAVGDAFALLGDIKEQAGNGE